MDRETMKVAEWLDSNIEMVEEAIDEIKAGDPAIEMDVIAKRLAVELPAIAFDIAVNSFLVSERVAKSYISGCDFPALADIYTADYLG